jgi:hypothetical protein
VAENVLYGAKPNGLKLEAVCGSCVARTMGVNPDYSCHLWERHLESVAGVRIST